ncbi:MAG: metalloregulator ArsR/SmtB family transcription factor [Acidimicrobiia bacterium]|nr:metalloregulator ArsR/SmtB family transcription factor [Acidimicrobiia bacterium]
MADVFKALAHPGRRQVLAALRRRPMTPSELSEELGIKMPNLSAQLSVLKDAELVHAERDGTSLTYRVNLSVLESTMATLMEQLGVGSPENGQPDDNGAEGGTGDA